MIRTIFILAVAILATHLAMDILGYRNFRIMQDWHINQMWSFKESAIYLVVFIIFSLGASHLCKKKPKT
jgi:hypothetical protein